MRERLDCAMLGFGHMAEWYGQKDGVYARGRLYLHHVKQVADLKDNIKILVQMSTQLQRFDVCLLAIDQENLPWIRQAMLAAQSRLRTPVIGLVRNLKAPAIGDLYNLGMADFVREPLCIEEIRIRTERLLGDQRPRQFPAYADMAIAVPERLQDPGKCYPSSDDIPSEAGHDAVVDVSHGCPRAPGLDAIHNATDLALDAFARASASQCAATAEPFGVAKSRVIRCFERAYIDASLARSSGNIAQAARSARKHRRAFWALMRKHNIDATPYRKVMPPKR